MDGEQGRPNFGDLPQALVQDVLHQALTLASGLKDDLDEVTRAVPSFRQKFGPIKTDKDLNVSQVPTACGVDGSYIVERLLSTDLAAYAVLAVEGVTPPSEKRFWPEPRHYAHVFCVSHHDTTSQLMRGLMMCRELRLATQAPHDVVMIDNALKTFLIYLNQATSKVSDCPSASLSAELCGALPEALESYEEILSGLRRDRVFAAIPKYSSLRELANRTDPSSPYDDRTLATLTLRPGEFLGPLDIAPDPNFHLTIPKDVERTTPDVRKRVERITKTLNEVQVVYYKPRQYLPAFRVEMARGVASNPASLGMALKAIDYQTTGAGLLEPYPLYLADRMVGHLGVAFPSFLQAVTHEMASTHAGDTGEVYLMMHSYRSEAGR